MSVKTLFLSILLLFSSSYALAFDKNDCIISGMKGVASDSAARQIRLACDQKSRDTKQLVLQKLTKEFGDIIEEDYLLHEEFKVVGEARYKNVSKDTVITFVRMAVWSRENGPGTPCQEYGGRRDFIYRLSLKPGASVTLEYPSAELSDCRVMWAAMGRKGRWTDVSLSSSVSPLDESPFKESDFNTDVLFGPAPAAPLLPKTKSVNDDVGKKAYSGSFADLLAATPTHPSDKKSKSKSDYTAPYEGPTGASIMRTKRALANALRD